MTGKVMVEAFRVTHSLCLKSFTRHPKAHGPRLKDCRGDEGVGIHVFAFFFGLKDCGPRLKDCRGDEQEGGL